MHLWNLLTSFFQLNRWSSNHLDFVCWPGGGLKSRRSAQLRYSCEVSQTCINQDCLLNHHVLFCLLTPHFIVHWWFCLRHPHAEQGKAYSKCMATNMFPLNYFKNIEKIQKHTMYQKVPNGRITFQVDPHWHSQSFSSKWFIWGSFYILRNAGTVYPIITWTWLLRWCRVYAWVYQSSAHIRCG